MSDMVSIEVNGARREVRADMSVAAALFACDAFVFRTSVSGEPRAALCGMGTCFECRVTIDGRLNARSCQVAVRDGMVIATA